MPWHLPWVPVRITQSTAIEKSTDDRVHHCLTLVTTQRGSISWLFSMTRYSKFLYKALKIFTDFCGILWCRIIFKSHGRRKLSKAFSNSMNTTYKELFHSCDCSRIWRRTNMWSMHDFPFLKPACSWRSSLSTAVVMRWRMMQQKTLLAMNSSVMPLQLIVPLFLGYHFIVPDVLEDVLKMLWHFLFFYFQHLCIHIVVPWCFTALQLHDCILDLFYSVMVDRPFAFTVRSWFCQLSPRNFLVIWKTVFISFRSVAASASVTNLP